MKKGNKYYSFMQQKKNMKIDLNYYTFSCEPSIHSPSRDLT